VSAAGAAPRRCARWRRTLTSGWSSASRCRARVGRLPDTSANPYLATAALIAARLDGIDRPLDQALAYARHVSGWELARYAAAF
jgi:glutamine synthetase